MSFEDILADAVRNAAELSDPGERACALTALLEQAQAVVSRLSADRDNALRALRGEGASYADIAKLLGVSRPRARELSERLAPDGEHREHGRAQADVRGEPSPAGAEPAPGSVNSDDETQVAASAAGGRLMMPGEVARLFGVDPRTVGRWASTGQLSCVSTPGGTRRYREADVDALLRQRAPLTWTAPEVKPG